MKVKREVEYKWHLTLTDKEMSFLKSHMSQPVRTGTQNEDELRMYEIERQEFWMSLDKVKA